MDPFDVVKFLFIPLLPIIGNNHHDGKPEPAILLDFDRFYFRWTIIDQHDPIELYELEYRDGQYWRLADGQPARDEDLQYTTLECWHNYLRLSQIANYDYFHQGGKGYVTFSDEIRWCDRLTVEGLNTQYQRVQMRFLENVVFDPRFGKGLPVQSFSRQPIAAYSYEGWDDDMKFARYSLSHSLRIEKDAKYGVHKSSIPYFNRIEIEIIMAPGNLPKNMRQVFVGFSKENDRFELKQTFDPWDDDDKILKVFGFKKDQ